MPLKYKINVLEELKKKGYNTNRLRMEKLLGESTIQKLRNNESISWDNIEKICSLLECQPGDLIEYVKGDEMNDRNILYSCHFILTLPFIMAYNTNHRRDGDFYDRNQN